MFQQRTKKISLSDLDRLDNGSFERMVQEIRKFAKNESEVEYYTHLRIMEGLARRGKRERMGLPTFPLDFFDHIPRKKRTTCFSEFRNIQRFTEGEQIVGGAVVKQEDTGKNEGACSKNLFCREDEEEGINLKKKKKKKKKKTNSNIKFVELGLDPPPELPINLRVEVEKRNGKNLMLVIMKELFVTDLNTNNSRFSIPVSQIRHPEFLTQEEKELLKEKEGTKKKGLSVTLIEPCLDECNLRLKEWPMNSTLTYALISGWNEVIHKKSLRVHDIVQLWSFRCDGKLWFLLHKVTPQITVDATSPTSVISIHELEG